MKVITFPSHDLFRHKTYLYNFLFSHGKLYWKAPKCFPPLQIEKLFIFSYVIGVKTQSFTYKWKLTSHTPFVLFLLHLFSWFMEILESQKFKQYWWISTPGLPTLRDSVGLTVLWKHAPNNHIVKGVYILALTGSDFFLPNSKIIMTKDHFWVSRG